MKPLENKAKSLRKGISRNILEQPRDWGKKKAARPLGARLLIPDFLLILYAAFTLTSRISRLTF